MTNQEIKIGDKVKVNILRNGYFETSYKGTVTGVKDDGSKIRVKTTFKGNRWYSRSNVYLR